MGSNFRLLLTAILICSTTAAFAKFPGILQRYEIFFTYPKAFGEYKRTDNISLGGPTQKLSIESKVRSEFSYGAGIGTFWPVSTLGPKGRLTLDLALQYSIYTYDLPGTNLGSLPDGTYTYNKDLLFSAATIQAGLPIGLSARFGCDALQDKGIPFCGSLGAGVYPTYSLSADFDKAEGQIGVQPYVKGEIGFYAGICMKLRLMYSFGRAKLLDSETTTSNNGQDFKNTTELTNYGTFGASLVIMPFAFTWKKDQWWNTF